MRIDINFQTSAQKLKYKAISNSLRKRKNEFHPWPTTARPRADAAQHEAAHNGEARARATHMQKRPSTLGKLTHSPCHYS